MAVSAVSRHLQAPTNGDMQDVERIYKYLKQTMDWALVYSTTDTTPRVTTDASYASCPVTRRSQTGLAVHMFGAAFIWKSRRQPSVALSSAEAEYMAMCAGAQKLLWLLQLLGELQIPGLTPPPTTALGITLEGDNMAALKMAEEGADSPATQHISIRYHFLKELVEAGIVQVQHVDTEHNVADVLTKPLLRVKHVKHTKKLLGHHH